MRGVVVIWHGDTLQIQALLVAIGHNCDCNGRPGSCSAHQALLDQHFIDRLLFAAYLRDRLLAEEHDG